MRYSLEDRMLYLSAHDFAGYKEEVSVSPSFRLRVKAGQDIHRNYQSEIPENAVAEYPVRIEQQVDDWTVEIRGKADVVIWDRDRVVVEEIKSVASHENLPESYTKQLQVYAHYFKYVENEPSVTAYLVSVTIDDGDRRKLPIVVTNLTKEIEKLARIIISGLKEVEVQKRELAKREMTITFPFERYRPYQEKIVKQMTKEIPKKKRFMLSAPPGIGKTIATLLPALKFALGKSMRVFAVTSKTTQQKIYKDTLNALHKSGGDFNATIITAKGKVCRTKDYNCENRVCPLLDNFMEFEGIDNLVTSMLNNKVVDSRKVKRIAKMYELCPFELSMEVALASDVIVCDYNYIFHPNVGFQRYAQAYPNSVLIVDEAHNLVNRASGYYTLELSVGEITRLIAHIDKQTPIDGDKTIVDFLGIARRILSNLRQFVSSFSGGGTVVSMSEERLEQIAELDENFDQIMIKILNRDSSRTPLVRFGDKLKSFVQLTRELGSGEFELLYYTEVATLKILCKSASKKLRKNFKKFHSVIVQSATIQPFEYFRDLLGLPKSTILLDYPSPFPPENSLHLIHQGIRTTYKERMQDLPLIPPLISSVIHQKRGNYLVFFPSFKYLRYVQRELEILLNETGVELRIQEENMSDHKRRKLLKDLLKSQNIVLLGVLGGIFSEGVDYPGEMAIGAFIVSPGLPNYNIEQELIRQYFEKEFGRGFEYAYRNPGMNKVVQAAGRVIRSETDRGVMVLIGKRFGTEYYRCTMPEYWDIEIGEDVISRINDFWNSSPADS